MSSVLRLGTGGTGRAVTGGIRGLPSAGVLGCFVPSWAASELGSQAFQRFGDVSVLRNSFFFKFGIVDSVVYNEEFWPI